MKQLGWERSIRASSLRGLQGRSATNQNGQAAKEKKEKISDGGRCSENISGFRLREKCFSLDIPLYRTSGWPVIPQQSAASANSSYLESACDLANRQSEGLSGHCQNEDLGSAKPTSGTCLRRPSATSESPAPCHSGQRISTPSRTA